VWVLGARVVARWPRDGSAVEPALARAGLPMMWVLLMQALSQWIVLAAISGTVSAAELGAFRVAAQLAGLVATVTMATEFYVAPRMAGDFRAGRPDLAWRRYRRGTLAMLALAAPVLGVAFLAPGLALELAFGPEFRVAATSLAIIAVAQLVNTARGPLGAMLSMSGNDRVQFWMTVGGLAIVLLLSATLIPRYGLEGAALAYSAPFIFRSIVGAILVRRLIPRERAP
jgi:O-antigen/teichoic acid export membrane protein